MNIESRILYKVNLDCYPKSADLSLKGQCHQMFDPFFDLQSLINSHSHGRYFINMLFFVRECSPSACAGVGEICPTSLIPLRVTGVS